MCRVCIHSIISPTRTLQDTSTSQPASMQQQNSAHAHENDDDEETTQCCCNMGCGGGFLFGLSILFVLIPFFPLVIWACLRTVKQYERGIRFRFGKTDTHSIYRPGLNVINVVTDRFEVVNMRTCSYDVPPQRILTKDSVTIGVDAVMFYRVSDPFLALSKVEDYKAASQNLAQTTLRNVLGTRDLADVLKERDLIASEIQSIIDEATDPWGVVVERVEIKDITLPQKMQRSMAAEAEAVRDARARVIVADGEQKAARSLKEASETMSGSPFAMQLRYLQTMTAVAQEKDSTLLFPIPMHLTTPFDKKNA